jgi:hypothetical protein
MPDWHDLDERGPVDSVKEKAHLQHYKYMTIWETRLATPFSHAASSSPPPQPVADQGSEDDNGQTVISRATAKANGKTR